MDPAFASELMRLAGNAAAAGTSQESAEEPEPDSAFTSELFRLARAAKRARTAASSLEKVTLNVGGTLFHVAVPTLRLSSSYFASLLSDAWAEGPDEEIFLDRDADAFKVLLSCLRSRAVLMPVANADLFGRALLEAEFFGVDWLVHEVKARAVTNSNAAATYAGGGGGSSGLASLLNGETSETRSAALAEAAAFFDLQFGGLQTALIDGVLPARYFAKEQRVPTIKQLLPPTPGDRVIFTHCWECDNEEPTWQRIEEPYPVVALVACVSANGAEYVDALINPRRDAADCPQPFHTLPVFSAGGTHGGTTSRLVMDGLEEQLMLASEFCRRRRDAGDWSPTSLWGISHCRETER